MPFFNDCTVNLPLPARASLAESVYGHGVIDIKRYLEPEEAANLMKHTTLYWLERHDLWAEGDLKFIVFADGSRLAYDEAMGFDNAWNAVPANIRTTSAS